MLTRKSEPDWQGVQGVVGPSASVLRGKGMDPNDPRSIHRVGEVHREYADAASGPFYLGVPYTYGGTIYRVGGPIPTDELPSSRHMALPDVQRMIERNIVAIGQNLPYFRNSLMSVASLGDSSLANAKDCLGIADPVEWSAERHAFQLNIFKQMGEYRLLGEAFASVDDAIGLVLAARKTGIKEVNVCFRVDSHGRIIDPKNQHITVAEIVRELRKVARGACEVNGGLNCSGLSGTLAALGRENHGIHAAYINGSDFPDVGTQQTFETLIEKAQRTPREEIILAEMMKRYITSVQEFRSFVAEALLAGVQIVGGCCGTDCTHFSVATKMVAHFRIHGRVPYEEESTSFLLAA